MSCRLVQFQVKGLSVEKLLNEAHRRGLVLKTVRRKKNRAVLVQCSPKVYSTFCALAQEKGYEVSPSRPVGLLRWEKRLTRRAGIGVGFLLGAALLIWSLGYVWTVQVENAGAYAGEVRLFLEETGIRPGIRRSSVSLAEVRERLEWRLPKVKWVRAEWAGVALRIRLEEGMPPPEIGSAGQVGNVVAAENGLITRLTVYAGTPAVREGEFVKAGQVLIRGEERGKNGEWTPVKACGEAVARLWISVQASVPSTEYVSNPTGRKTERRMLQTPLFSWALEDAPEYLTSDLSREKVPLGGAWLPVWLIREQYQEAALREEERNPEEVKREGAKAAIFRLNQLLRNEETVDKWINFSMIEGDTMTVTATAEVLRDIGRFASP